MPYLGNQALPGLHPVGAPTGTVPKITWYTVPAAYNTSIGEGCLLIKVATGVQLMTIAYTASTVVGVAAANVLATTTATLIPVYDDPNQEFAVIADAAVTAANRLVYLGQYVGITTGSNVYTSTYQQGNVSLALSTATTNSTTSLPLVVTGYLDAVGETITAASNQVLVKINPVAHQWAQTTSNRV
jgi:hypothetical protein